jgi:hypothetical protein
LTYAYSFGPGYANAVAVPCDGGVAVISPPCNPSDASFAPVEKLGKVRAIVAPNGFHLMGLSAWKARYPDATVFAPAQSIARVEKKGGVSGVKPVGEAAKVLGPSLEVLDIPHYKTGEALIRFKHGDRTAWYLTDIIMNMPVLPPKFPFKQLFSWTKSGPGLRPNGLAAMLMMKDKNGVYAWMRDQLGKAPPTDLLLSHGEHVVGVGDAAKRLSEILPS